MRSPSRSLLPIAIVLGLAPGAAGAGTSSLRLEAGLGPGFEFGYLVYGWSPRAALQLDAGIGSGLLGIAGHVAARYVAQITTNGHLLVGFGLAATVVDFDGSLEDSLPMIWATADVAYQYHVGRRWFLWLSAGATKLVSKPDEGCECIFNEALLAPVATVGFGATF